MYNKASGWKDNFFPPLILVMNSIQMKQGGIRLCGVCLLNHCQLMNFYARTTRTIKYLTCDLNIPATNPFWFILDCVRYSSGRVI